MAGAFLFDNDINLIASIEENKLIENYQESELGSSIIGYCSLPFHLFIEDSKYFGVKDDDNFFLYRIIKTVRKKNEISITGIHIFFDELNTRIVKDLRPKNKTASFILSEILKDTDWKVGLSDIDTLGSKSFYYQSCLSAFYEVIKLFDCEFKLRINFTNGKIVDKRVDLIKSIKLDYGRWFELGDKLLSVEAESNDGEVFTAFVGRGKGIEVTDENGNSTGGYSRKITFKDIGWGKPNDPLNKPVGSERLVFDNMVNIYGYREAVVDFEDIEDPKKLLEKTYEYGLEHSRPRVQLKAKAVGEHVRLGEICTIINDKLKIRYKTRVFKLKIDHLCKDKIEFEFGDKIKTSVADRLSAQSEDLKKSKESIEKGLESFKRQVGNQIINSYFNEDGYNYEFKADNKYNLPAGLYSFDKPIEMNPTKVIYFGAGKIMIANSKKSDGTWNWTTFGTGDGFTADKIIAGILQGGKVRWNLEDGTFLIGKDVSNYNFYWDGSTLHMENVDIDLTNNSVVKNMNQNIDKNNEDIKKANDAITQTQTSVQVLKDSISSKVSKTEILSDKEIQNALKGRDGADGKTPYLHIAYSNSQDGSKDFITTDSNRDYIGTYTDYVKADSTDPKKYNWSKIKGEFEGEIGGRNLIKNSDDLSNCFYKFDGGNHEIVDVDMPGFGFSGKKVQSLAGNQTDGTKEIMLLDSENLIDGKTYTFSMYVKNNRDVPMRFNIKSIESNLVEIKPNSTQRLVVTGKKIEDTNASGKFRVFFNANTKDYYIDCTVSRPQLEEGDVATSWKPNPLDLISETQTVKRTFEAYKEQTDRRLLSTVSQTDFNKNNVAIKKQFSSVDQKANGIISTVSSKYKDLSKKIDGKPSTTTVQSLISQKVDSVKIEVSNQISGVNSSIRVMQDKIELKADKTDLYGLVSFSDLKDSNSWTVINGENIKTGKISSADGSSWINLKDGNFSFYHNSLFIDENEYDWNSRTKRTRLHTLGTFRVSYGNSPSVELNSGGITLFKNNVGQDSKGTNKIQSNSDGNVQIGSIDDNSNTTIYAEIGKKEGYVMHIYGSLFVHRNLRVKDAIRYGASCQQGTTF